MLDPVTALSIASAAIQFVSFGTTIIGTAYKIYRSKNGETKENAEIERVTTQLKNIIESLNIETTDHDEGSKDEKELLRAAQECCKVADRLLLLLADLRFDQSRLSRVIGAARAALKLRVNEGRIKTLRDELETLTSQVTLCLSNLTRKEQSSITKSVRELTIMSNRMHLESMEQIDKLKHAVHLVTTLQETADFVRKERREIEDLRRQAETLVQERQRKRKDRFSSFDLRSETKLAQDDLAKHDNILQHIRYHETCLCQLDEEQTTLQRRILTSAPRTFSSSKPTKPTVYDEDRANNEAIQASITAISEQLERIHRAAVTISVATRFLASLYFPSMPARSIEIPEAYDGTWTWIFQSDRTQFRNWLTSSSGLFWINGKAGSGKSTLMKYIATHESTMKALTRWATEQNRHVVVTSYYFWKAGNEMQKSQQGLLQSLLHQIFSECPELIATACAKRWQSMQTSSQLQEPWTGRELSNTLEALLQHTQASKCFCFFIDGLDEYKGDLDTMIDDIERLSQWPLVKICVSSRPWNPFVEAFGLDPGRQFILQDYNRSDLDRYIKGNLEDNARYRKLAAKDERATAFAIEIRDKANGVFLWVRLVVRSLLDGLREGDSIFILQERLSTIPLELEDYFEQMLQTIDAHYRKYTARAFLIACNAHPLPVSSYRFLEVELSDQDYALHMSSTGSSDVAEHTAEDVARWINKCCRDLLEVTTHRGRSRVNFLHRTARDFLVADDMQVMFAKRAGADFNPRMSLCRSYLAEAKTVSDISEFISAAGNLMYHAKALEVMDSLTPLTLLESLDRTGASKAQRFSSDHWTCRCPRTDDLNPLLKQSNFLSYAVEFDLCLSVQEMLQRDPLRVRKPEGAQLLDHALRPTVRHEEFVGERGPLNSMIQLLLQNGATVSDTLLENGGLSRFGGKFDNVTYLRVSRAMAAENLDQVEGECEDGSVLMHLGDLSLRYVLGTSSVQDSHLLHVAHGGISTQMRHPYASTWAQRAPPAENTRNTRVVMEVSTMPELDDETSDPGAFKFDI